MFASVTVSPKSIWFGTPCVAFSRAHRHPAVVRRPAPTLGRAGLSSARCVQLSTFSVASKGRSFARIVGCALTSTSRVRFPFDRIAEIIHCVNLFARENMRASSTDGLFHAMQAVHLTHYPGRPPTGVVAKRPARPWWGGSRPGERASDGRARAEPPDRSGDPRSLRTRSPGCK